MSVIEASRFVRSRVDLRLHLCNWGIECVYYVSDLLPHALLLPCSYWEYGIVFHYYVVHGWGILINNIIISYSYYLRIISPIYTCKLALMRNE